MNQETTATDRSTEFRPVTDGEVQSGEMLLIQAYAAMWLLLFGLLAFLWSKQRDMRARLDRVDRALEKLPATADSK